VSEITLVLGSVFLVLALMQMVTAFRESNRPALHGWVCAFLYCVNVMVIA
jgi:hypothetical protein